MHDDAVERLFSLFTSSARAIAMAGDLAEEREQRGWSWFWLQVVRITFALWRNAALEAPLRVLALTLAGAVLAGVTALGGVAAVFLVPRFTASPAGWIALPLLWWGGALCTGALLVVVAPRSGMAACAVLAVVGESLLIGFAGPEVWQDPGNTDFVIFCTTGLFAGLPLLAGAAVARQRFVDASVVPQEPSR
jgi:hypothetical protein